MADQEQPLPQYQTILGIAGILDLAKAEWVHNLIHETRLEIKAALWRKKWWAPHSLPLNYLVDITTFTGLQEAIRVIVWASNPNEEGFQDKINWMFAAERIEETENTKSAGVAVGLAWLTRYRKELLRYMTEQFSHIMTSRRSPADELEQVVARHLAAFPILDSSKFPMTRVPIYLILQLRQNRPIAKAPLPLIMNIRTRTEEQESVNLRPQIVSKDKITVTSRGVEILRDHEEDTEDVRDNYSSWIADQIKVLEPTNRVGAELLNKYDEWRGSHLTVTHAAAGLELLMNTPEPMEEEPLPPVNINSLDPARVLAAAAGANWLQLTLAEVALKERGRAISPAREKPLPAMDHRQFLSSKTVYPVQHENGIPFLVRMCDPASRFCDPAKARGKIHDLIPTLPDDHRDVTYEEMDHFNEQNMPWNDETNAGKELYWPGYTTEAECVGILTQMVEPNDGRTAIKAGRDRTGRRIQPLYATTQSLPSAFMRYQVPAREHHAFAKMTIANPYDVEQALELDGWDVFIAGGPLTWLPTPHVWWSRQAIRRRCSLCYWMSARTVGSNLCKHAICSTCLGLTSLVSIEHYVCLKCWKIPERVSVSWAHRAGEQRLYFTSPELVTVRGLSHHYRLRFTKYWGVTPLYSPEEVIRKNMSDWTKHIKRENWNVSGGAGKPPGKDDLPPNSKI